MKKILILAMAAVLLAGSAFAAAAVKPAAATQDSKALAITTDTRLSSEARYPGELIRGSISGSAVFPADYGRMPSTILVDWANNTVTPWIFTSLRTDFGKIGLSVREESYTGLIGIDLGPRIHVFGLHYAGDILGMNGGVELTYGTGRDSYEHLNPVLAPVQPYKYDRSTQQVGMRVGFAFEAGLPFDASFGASLTNNINDEVHNYAGSTMWNHDYTRDLNSYSYDGAFRADFGGDFTGLVNLKWTSAQDISRTATPGNVEDTYTYSNDVLEITAIASRDFKVTEWLKIRAAAGLSISGTANADFVWHHKDSAVDLTQYIPTPAGFYEESVFWIPAYVGVETKLNDTWSASAGFKLTSLINRSRTNFYNADPSLYTEMLKENLNSGAFDVDPGVEYACGISGEIGNLKIDLTVNTDFLTNGPFFLSGTTTPSLNTALALRFDW